jgi:hypothetical protein
MKRISKVPTVSGSFSRFLVYSITAMLLAAIVLPSTAFAAQLNNRTLTLGSSQGNTSTTWTIQFDPSVTTALNGITFQVCDAASGTCNIPGSWTNAGSAFSSLTYNGSSQSGWALDNAAGFLRIKNNASVATTASPIVATFNTVTNPNTTNATFFVRILTYTGDDYTGQLDSGVVAASTAQQFTVSASIDESLTFCVGASGITTSSCTGATGSTASLGTLSASTTGSTFSQLGVGTNAGTGYSITVTGTTLTSGGNTISALGSRLPSAVGGEQFGINLRDNATPNVGTNPDGAGTANPATEYNVVDEYKYVDGDTIVNKTSADSFRRFHVSYIANIGTASEPGSYSTALTYICTAAY